MTESERKRTHELSESGMVPWEIARHMYVDINEVEDELGISTVSITATKDQIQKAFDLWYEEHGRQPEEFTGLNEDAADTFIQYLQTVQHNNIRPTKLSNLISFTPIESDIQNISEERKQTMKDKYETGSFSVERLSADYNVHMDVVEKIIDID